MRGFVVIAALVCAAAQPLAAQPAEAPAAASTQAPRAKPRAKPAQKKPARPQAAPPTIDAGVPDAASADGGVANAAQPTDAGVAADPELREVEVAERDLAAQAEEARLEKEAANAAEARARQEQADADSRDELLISTARADLEASRAAQADFRRGLVAGKSELTANARAHIALVKRARAAFASGGAYDALYDDVELTLSERLAAGLDDAADVLRAPPSPPGPPALSDEVLALSERRPVAINELRALRKQLEDAQATLATQRDELLERRIDDGYAQAQELGSIRAQLLGKLSANKRDQVLGLRNDAIVGARIEFVHIALQVGYWLRIRLDQARGRLTTTEDWLALGEVVWSIIEVLLILLALRIALGRWELWMTGLVASLGKSMHLGSGALFLARLAELARSFGPPLLVALAALGARALLDDRRVTEVEVAFIIVFWMAVFRTQLRFVEAFSRAVGVHRAERRTQQRELEHALNDDGTDAKAAPDKSVEEPPGLQPSWQTLSRTWGVATRYFTTLYILRELIEYGAGAGVNYHLVSRAAWWGMIPLAIYALHIWRARIVFEYLRRSDSREGWLAQLAGRHANRFYGSLVVIPALAVVVARQTAGFVRRHLSNLDSTKRLFAWMFRRRVERHAQEHGRVLERQHALPEVLLSQFPARALDPEDRPTKPACLAEIKSQFERWTNRGSEGSVALVGAAGMGKSTILRSLAKELETPVERVSLISKVSTPEALYRRLARLLELDGEPTTQAEMVSLLHGEARRIIAIDNCHNLFLRQVGGFEAWEAFTHLVNETSDKVFWVATFNDVAWDYLNNIAARLSYFRSIIRLKGWTDTEIRHLILSRMRRARFKTSFTDLLVTRIEGVSMSSQIIGTSQGYFRLLWDFTNGNPRDACHFWLRSLVPQPEDERRVRVHLFAAPRIEELQNLPDDIIFVLQAIVEHENLTADELTRVTNTSPEFCRFALRYCREHGYLERDATTGRSQLSTHWYQTVLRYLKRQHLIYS